MSLACLLATFAVFPQDPPPQALVERLDALIEKTNAYEGFVAIYHLHNRKGEDGQMRLLFRAPDRFKLEAEIADQRCCFCARGDHLEVRGKCGTEPQTTVSLPDVGGFLHAFQRLRDELQSTFPGCLPPGSARGQGGLGFTLVSNSTPPDFSYGIDIIFDGAARLTWLDRARPSPQLAVNEVSQVEELHYPPCEKSRVVISPDSGFVSRIEKELDEGVLVGIRLESLDLDARPEEAEFRAPAPEEGAQDVSAECQQQFAWQAFRFNRAKLGELLGRMLDGGRIEWTEEVPKKLDGVLRRIHDVDLAPIFQRSLDEGSVEVSQVAERLRQALAELQPDDEPVRDRIAQGVRRYRAELEQRIAKGIEGLLAIENPPLKCTRRPSLRDELLALEKPILQATYAERVTQVQLALFDEKIGKQLEAK